MEPTASRNTEAEEAAPHSSQSLDPSMCSHNTHRHRWFPAETFKTKTPTVSDAAAPPTCTSPVGLGPPVCSSPQAHERSSKPRRLLPPQALPSAPPLSVQTAMLRSLLKSPSLRRDPFTAGGGHEAARVRAPAAVEEAMPAAQAPAGAGRRAYSISQSSWLCPCDPSVSHSATRHLRNVTPGLSESWRGRRASTWQHGTPSRQDLLQIGQRTQTAPHPPGQGTRNSCPTRKPHQGQSCPGVRRRLSG